MATVERRADGNAPAMTTAFREKYFSWLRNPPTESLHHQSSLFLPGPGTMSGNMTASVTTHKLIAMAKDFGIDLAAGTAGATVSVYAGQPLDTVKVKMQTFPELHRTMGSCMANTLRREGIRGLYAGTVPALVANVAENSVLFAAYGLCQRAVAHLAGAQGPDDLSSLGNATAGFLAAFFSSLTMCPTELVKCRLQAMLELHQAESGGAAEPTGRPSSLPQQRRAVGPWSVTRHILQTEGIRGMFCGLSSTLAREMPGYFFFFGGYELTRSVLAKEGQSKDDIGLFNTFLSGGVAGVVLWTAMFPVDVIKSRIQVMNSRETMLRMAVHIFRHEGVGAFYNGLRPTVLRTFPATGLLLVTYETVKKSLRDYTSMDS